MKTIPVILNGKRQIYKMDFKAPVVTRVYEHFRKVFNIRHIYRDSKAVYMDVVK